MAHRRTYIKWLWMPHCTNKRCHVDSTCMTNLFNQAFVIGKFSRMYPTEQIDQTIDLGKLIKLTDRTIGQSYFLNGRTCTLESTQVLNFKLGIQISQQFWTLHNKNGLWFVSIYLTKISKGAVKNGVQVLKIKCQLPIIKVFLLKKYYETKLIFRKIQLIFDIFFDNFGKRYEKKK